jgi:hypothetical protein
VANAEKGENIYRVIFDRIAERVFGTSRPEDDSA